MTLETHPGEPTSPVNELEQQASAKEPGLVAEFLYFLAHEKKWWLVPIVLILLLLGLILVVSGTGLGPFIYPFL